MVVALFCSIFAFFVIVAGLRRLLRFRRRFPQPPPPVPTSAPPSSSPSRSLWTYDVFLSFRGEDVRKGFLSHLFKALTDDGIHVFRDDKELQRGNFIGPGLLDAIEESRFAIVVLSENYANSRWCLEELSHITECAVKKRIGLIPVFYGINPSDVKRQSGSFERAFEEHEQRFDLETVERWRKAFAQVGKISGWDSRNWNEESKLIEELVQDLSDRLFLPTSSETGELVGMSSHMRNIYPLLCFDSDDVRMVGIWGMGGIGKTTIAKFLHKRLMGKFHGACLLENVKGKFKQHDPSHLRERILSEIFRKKDLNTWDGDSDAMKRRLQGKKVLLVLDDVDNIEQIQELAKSSEWFGQGSRIIITTRDKRVLDQHDVEHIYEVNPLRTTQALRLFSRHAFKQPRPLEDFRELSIDVVERLGGIPLALRVVGASLYRRDISYWEDKVLVLKNNLDNSVLRTLRVSYDALDKQEKMVFLYVACCFNGEYMDRVRKVLDLFVVSSGRRPLPSRPSIITLMEKCLISCSSRKRLWVHGLLQDMAKDVIRDGNDDKPWKRKMLWDFDDIYSVFSGNMVGHKFLVLILLLVNLCIRPTVFERMRNLKLLKFYQNHSVGKRMTSMPDGLDYLPMLRYLHWDAYSLKSLPSRFCMIYLVELNLSNSSVETLWNGSQDLENLRRMNLTNCRSLAEIPDLSKATNLESLKLSNCESLAELPYSLGHLNKLEELKLRNCKNLKNLPDNINLKSLRFLYLDGCSGLKEFPFVSENIEKLTLNETAIEEVPPSIERLSRLSELRFTGCKRLKNLPDTIANLESLGHLGLANCPNVESFPQVGRNIRWLYLNGTAIEEVPSTIGERSELIYLNMSGCERLENLPPALRKLTQLKYLYLRGCSRVTQAPEVGGTVKALDLHGTSIERNRPWVGTGEEEEHEMPRCEVPVIRRFFLRNVREHIKRKKSSR
ncbi:PREDICTED: protein SUPPRESSOR OF npr1-1, CONSTITUTIVE 1-like [Tarenaya hassleriana]|uniref:protein SUPPRESSOR OF npr1-1, CONSTITUTIVE 1-like n=1 Tax=Tarenaya hassleriana TaxID=28532 RepID=UPI00053C28BF|nr:PREDICTED: protein SUPPRESSOR OF npr1-1, CONSTITUTIVE 1-like [Tarenaya hassleriana]